MYVLVYCSVQDMCFMCEIFVILRFSFGIYQCNMIDII